MVRTYYVEVDVHDPIIYLNQTPIFEWSVIRRGFKNGYQKDNMCLKVIGLCTQNMLTIISLTINMMGRTYSMNI